MPEQLLDRPQVGAPLEQMGCVRVSEAVRVREEPPERARVESSAAHGDEHGVARPACERRPPVAQPEPEAPRRFLAEWHEPFLAALAADVELLAVEVDVRQVQPDGLGGAKPARVDELEEGGVAQLDRVAAGDTVDGSLDVLELERLREAPDSSGRQGRVGTRAGPSACRTSDRTAESRRPMVAGASPRRERPSSPVYSARTRTSTSSIARPRSRSQAAKSRRSER